MFRVSLIAPVIAALLITSVAVVACGGDDDDSSGNNAPAASTQPSGGSGPTTVTTVDFGFQPNTLTARVGQAVNINLNNTGATPHTFTITGVVDSGIVAAGQSRAVTFTPAAAGSLTYICTVHGAASMSGTLTVTQ